MPAALRDSGFVESQGERVYFEVVGDGPPLVLAHGAGGTHAVWYQQVAALADRFRIITFDHRGFGRSTDRAEQSGPESAVSDLAAIFEHLKLQDAHIVGQSMGGWTALGFVLAHPERARSLLLSGTIGGIQTESIHAAFVSAVRALGGTAVEDRRIGDHPALGKVFQERDPAGAFLYQQMASLNEPPPAAAGARLLATRWPLDRVRALRVPTCFVVGAEDPIFPPDVVRAAAAEIEGARVHVVPESGHSPYFELPEQFNALLLAFLEGVS